MLTFGEYEYLFSLNTVPGLYAETVLKNRSNSYRKNTLHWPDNKTQNTQKVLRRILALPRFQCYIKRKLRGLFFLKMNGKIETVRPAKSMRLQRAKTGFLHVSWQNKTLLKKQFLGPKVTPNPGIAQHGCSEVCRIAGYSWRHIITWYFDICTAPYTLPVRHSVVQQSHSAVRN